MYAQLKHYSMTTALLVSVFAISALGCGPSFPNSVLKSGDDFMLDAPGVNFAREIAQIKPPMPTNFEAVEPNWERYFYDYHGERYHRQTSDADVNDLKDAIELLRLSKSRKESVLAEYTQVRKAIFEYKMALADWKWQEYDPNKKPAPEFDVPEVPKRLPLEFAMYLRGAIFYHKKELDEARKIWIEFLKLPESYRKYRSTWAAFMIGKSFLKEKPDQACVWFRKVRQLAEKGFNDSLGLASSSLGWEGRAQLNQGNYDKAIELYVVQLATGEKTAMASLRYAARDALQSQEQSLQKVALSPTARKVVTAYLISRSSFYSSWSDPRKDCIRKWLEAIEAVNVPEIAQAGRLAWAAYQAGEMKYAERWAGKASEDSILAGWVRAKLLLRAGKTAQAANQLAKCARGFSPVGHRREYTNQFGDVVSEHIYGELGALRLGQGQYMDAMEILLDGGYWEDAAYIAERVLTVDELKNYVDRRCLQGETDIKEDVERTIFYGGPADETPGSKKEGTLWFAGQVRYLLGRRLARLGRLEEARVYYPSKMHETFNKYVKLLGQGRDVSLPMVERAEHLWEAAKITRHQGMELFGTEVEPDWFIWEGNFPLLWYSKVRDLTGTNDILQSTPDERRRVKQHKAKPQMRFHYRYVAAECAWEVSEMMPDNSDETARVLCIAGSWLQYRDPEAADRFYKALVLRCRETELGKEADKLRWFPKIEEQ